MPYKHSEETKAKISASMSKKDVPRHPQTPETRAKISAGNKGRVNTRETLVLRSKAIVRHPTICVEKALEMRNKGYLYKEIAEELGIAVGTVWGFCNKERLFDTIEKK